MHQSHALKIATEHENLRGQIDQLKTSLEDAQMSRKRKIEYDVIAEKINTLPSREELDMYVLCSCMYPLTLSQ
jgi:THO complex subunit 7